MNLDPGQLDDALDTLTDDGKEWDVDDIHKLRLSVRPDEGYTVMDDGDWFGRLVWTSNERWSGRSQRPSDFTSGRDEILIRDGSYCLWWERPEDITDVPAFRRSLLDLYESGYTVVGVDALERVTDSLGNHHWIVLGSDGLGGIGGCDADVLRDLIPDLIANLPDIS